MQRARWMRGEASSFPTIGRGSSSIAPSSKRWLDAAKHLARVVHQHYFEPEYEEFQPRTLWSLSYAFTSAFKKLDPIPAFNATAKLGPFIEQFH